MPTDFEPDRPQARRRWIPLLLIGAILVAAIALASRQVDRTTAVAPDKAPSEKTIGLAPEKTK
jgi:hypothetical protein